MSIKRGRTTGTENAVSISYLLVETEHFQGQQDPQARLFSNRIQTCNVLITVQGRNANGEVVPLPDNLDINIIPYTSASGNWNSTMVPPPAGIHPFPEQYNAPAQTAEHPENFQQFRRYIRYQAVPAGTVNQFAASVKLGSVTYTTNNRDVQYGGAGENGRFHSSFRLRSVEPLQYTSFNNGLVITGPTEVFSAPISGFTTKVQNWYINLRYPGTSSSVSFFSGSDTTANSSLHDNKATALGNPGSAIAKKNLPTNNQLGQALNQALATILQPRSDTITVAVGMYARVSELFVPQQTSYYSAAIDMYGNPLRFSCTLRSEYPQRGPWDYTLGIEWAG